MSAVILYGPPATGKDTVTEALTCLDENYRLYRRLKVGAGRTVGYRMTTLSHIKTLRSAGSVVWETRRYDALYVIDRASLTNMLTVCIPVLHVGQAEAVKAVTAALPQPCPQRRSGLPYGCGALAISPQHGPPNVAQGTPQPGYGHGRRPHPCRKLTSRSTQPTRTPPTLPRPFTVKSRLGAARVPQTAVEQANFLAAHELTDWLCTGHQMRRTSPTPSCAPPLPSVVLPVKSPHPL
jgi:hypothetical protein